MKKAKTRNKTWYEVDKKRLFILAIIVIVVIFGFNKKQESLNRVAYKPGSKYGSGEIAAIPRPNTSASPLPQSRATPITKVSAISYHSSIAHLSFSVPSSEYTVDSSYQYKNGANIHWIQVNEPKIDRSYVFGLANTTGDLSIDWADGRSYALVGKISDGQKLEKIITTLKSYGVNTQYIKTGTLPNSEIKYYLSYNKQCRGVNASTNCELTRMYLIPYEKIVEGNLYHTLAFSITIPLDGTVYNTSYTEALIDEKIMEYWKYNFATNAFPTESQKIFAIQDQIIDSLVLDKN